MLFMSVLSTMENGFVPFSCKTRFCPSYGKVGLMNGLIASFNVTSLSPSQLRGLFRNDYSLDMKSISPNWGS